MDGFFGMRSKILILLRSGTPASKSIDILENAQNKEISAGCFEIKEAMKAKWLIGTGWETTRLSHVIKWVSCLKKFIPGSMTAEHVTRQGSRIGTSSLGHSCFEMLAVSEYGFYRHDVPIKLQECMAKWILWHTTSAYFFDLALIGSTNSALAEGCLEFVSLWLKW